MMSIKDLFPNGIQTYLVGGILLGVAVSFAFAMAGQRHCAPRQTCRLDFLSRHATNLRQIDALG